MLEITPDKIQKIIILAEKCYPNNEQDKLISISDIPVEDIVNVSPKKKALSDEVSSLKKEEIVELCALMWLGRGAIGENAKDWDNLVKNGTGISTVNYICEQTPLAEYLREGMRKLDNQQCL